MTPARTIAVALSAGCAMAWTSFACGNLGQPPFVGSDGSVMSTGVTPPSVTADADDEEASPMQVSLSGIVHNRATDAALPMALVAIEVGGLGQTNPAAFGADGGIVPTLAINPFYQYGAITGPGGAFSLEVPDESLGVHVYASGFLCGVPSRGAVTPSDAGVRVDPEPLMTADGGAEPAKPTITGFTATPAIAAPGETLTMSARVEAAEPETDPLSDQVLAVELTSGWAGAFAPPEPGSQDAGYPNGVYARLVPAPLTPGKYTYYLVAATRSCVVSAFATQTVLVTPTGEGGDEGAEP